MNNELIVDYVIPTSNQKPIYLFGVNDDTKASKVVIACLHFINNKIPYQSLVIHEDSSNLSKFNQKQLMNTADKQYASLEDFKKNADEFAARFLASQHKFVPFDKLLAAFRMGITELWELAEHFGVTEDFIKKAYALYEEKLLEFRQNVN